MGKILDSLFGKKIDNTRVFPVTVKIIIIFTLFILVSNFSSNYINLIFNRSEHISLMKQLLAKDLKDAYTFCDNQFEIYQYTENLDESVKAIESKGLKEFTKKKSVLLGIKPDGEFLFQSSNVRKQDRFADKKVLELMNDTRKKDIEEGFTSFYFNDEEYFGYYKYNEKWDIFIVRAEEFNEFYKESRRIFWNISIIIILITITSAIVGIFLLRYILRFISIITNEIMKMVDSQQLSVVELKNAPNDDITYLGVAFNSLASTIDNLVSIFRKFVNKDIALQAYREREVRLEGSERDLAILFTDIKSFTFITETLGSDIIKLLNLHYTRAIQEIMEHDGVIGSIIGDALLAVYGALDDTVENKSYQAVLSAYKLQQVAKSLRVEMKKKKEEIEKKKKGALTAVEKKIYKAVLLEIGVGIDGGSVFYGNIGSYARMTNTVIGDNVNSASRLEGLTRIYKVPIVCSEYIAQDVDANVENHDIHFLEIDTVQVKGKTTGKRIYWPIIDKYFGKDVNKQVKSFSEGLELYYDGNWKKAHSLFKKCNLPLADVFVERTKDAKCPRGWNGIWEMKTK